MAFNYAGRFIIDTGYDDPGGFGAGLVAAEIYGARGSPRNSLMLPSRPGGSPAGRWAMSLTPVWASNHFVVPGGPAQLGRIFLISEAFYDPDGSPATWVALTRVSWSIYRL